MSLWGILPDPPSTPGDTDAAAEHHQRIVALLDADDAEYRVHSNGPKHARQFPRLTKYQRDYLLRILEPKWLKRACGADLRWNLYGPDKHGRLPRDLERACRGEPPIRADPLEPDRSLAQWIRADSDNEKEL